jgi:hypothetical protein
MSLRMKDINRVGDVAVSVFHKLALRMIDILRNGN